VSSSHAKVTKTSSFDSRKADNKIIRHRQKLYLFESKIYKIANFSLDFKISLEFRVSLILISNHARKPLIIPKDNQHKVCGVCVFHASQKFLKFHSPLQTKTSRTERDLEIKHLQIL